MKSKASKKPPKAKAGNAKQHAEGIPESLEVPKYPLDIENNETQTIDREVVLRLAWYLSHGISRKGCSVTHHIPVWRPNSYGIGKFRGLVRQKLVASGRYAESDLQGWTFIEILAELMVSLSGEDGTVHTQWKRELGDIYGQAIHHKEYWQSQTREAIKAIQEYSDSLVNSSGVNRAPLPNMPNDNRPVDSDDTFWRYLVLGMKLEDVFQNRYAFIPEDVGSKLTGSDLWGYVENPVFVYCYVVLTMEDSKALWVEIKADLNKVGSGDPKQPRIDSGGNEDPAGGGDDGREVKDGASGAIPGNKSEMTGEARAMAVLIDHPDWTNKKIAKEIGINSRSLSRYKKFKAARDFAKEAGKDVLPKGHRAADGDLEAY